MLGRVVWRATMQAWGQGVGGFWLLGGMTSQPASSKQTGLDSLLTTSDIAQVYH